jgi:DHA2 family multidrug resistance protein
VSYVDRTDVPNRGLITLILGTATMLVTLDSTVANIALPHVMGSISAAPDQITWVITSYMVASAISMPMTGWLSNRLGRKTVLLTAVGGFTVSSMLCGISSSLPEIVLYRVLQGLFGAPLMPLTQAELFDMNPPERHGRAMAVYGLGSLVGPVIGPTIGGFITESFSWRWIFYVNAPVGAVSFLGLLVLVSPSRHERAKPFDFLGYGMLVLFLAGLQLVLDRGPHEDWFSSSEIWAEAVVAAMALWVFIFHSATASNPFFDLSLFKDRNFVTMGIIGLFGFFLLTATSALLPLMLQTVLDLPAMTAGMTMIPRGIGATIGTVSAGRLMGRFDTRLLIIVGLCLVAFSMWRMSQFDLSMDRRPIYLAGIIQGVGFGLVSVPVTTAAFATLSQGMRAEGASLLAVMRSMGGSAGVAAMQALITRQSQAMHASLAAYVIPSDAVVRSGLGRLVNPASSAGALALDAEINRQAAMVAYVDDFRTMFFIALGCMPLLLIIRKPRPSGGDTIHAASR